jgi:hypothetical protein
MDASSDSLPIGRFGRIEAIGLTAPDGDHALLVREAGAQRALLTADSAERLIVTPLDDEVEIRVDGDALAVWLGSAPVTASTPSEVPGWASVVGLALLLILVALTVIGGAVAAGWVVEMLGG